MDPRRIFECWLIKLMLHILVKALEREDTDCTVAGT
jgi:hypothetical protein